MHKQPLCSKIIGQMLATHKFSPFRPFYYIQIDFQIWKRSSFFDLCCPKKIGWKTLKPETRFGTSQGESSSFVFPPRCYPCFRPNRKPSIDIEQIWLAFWGCRVATMSVLHRRIAWNLNLHLFLFCNKFVKS